MRAENAHIRASQQFRHVRARPQENDVVIDMQFFGQRLELRADTVIASDDEEPPVSGSRCRAIPNAVKRSWCPL